MKVHGTTLLLVALQGGLAERHRPLSFLRGGTLDFAYSTIRAMIRRLGAGGLASPEQVGAKTIGLRPGRRGRPTACAVSTEGFGTDLFRAGQTAGAEAAEHRADRRIHEVERTAAQKRKRSVALGKAALHRHQKKRRTVDLHPVSWSV